jgi:hypothetical protein
MRFIRCGGATRKVLTMSFLDSVRCLFVPFSAVCLVVVSGVGTGFGQTSTATLTGIIEDQNGAVLPNVAVTAIDMDRNAERVTRTNDVGNYTLPALDPGSTRSQRHCGFRNPFRWNRPPGTRSSESRCDWIWSDRQTVHVTAAAP